MSLKLRAILVVVIGLVMGTSLSIGGGLLGRSAEASSEDPSLEQARLFLEVMQRVKREYVEPLDDEALLDAAPDVHSPALAPEMAAEAKPVLDIEGLSVSFRERRAGRGEEVNMGARQAGRVLAGKALHPYTGNLACIDR